MYELKSNYDPACEKWEVCNEEAKVYELAFLACNEDTDCLNGEICIVEKHRCYNGNKKDALGIEGNECYEGSCDAGLECVDNICKRNETISASTIILSNTEIDKNIISNDENIISVKRDERNERLRVSNILTAGITEKTPYGLLKKIKSIRRFDDHLEIEVEDAPDLSEVTNMGEMFREATSFNQPLNSWDVSNVTDMRNMFYGATFNQNISSWDVSSVTDMNSMFNNAVYFNQDLSNWNVCRVTNFNDFSSGATNWVLPKPNFGMSCP